MENEDKCYLCDGTASVEIVKSEGGNRFDVLCKNSCPRYVIARGAIDYLRKHPLHRQEAIENAKEKAKSGKFPVIRTVEMPPKLWVTSREEE